jgi:hypothetical protein
MFILLAIKTWSQKTFLSLPKKLILYNLMINLKQMHGIKFFLFFFQFLLFCIQDSTNFKY